MILTSRASAPTVRIAAALLALLVFLLPALVSFARANDTGADYATWPLLTPEFPSTGGGGIMIHGYDPQVANNLCRTDFEAVTPDGQVYRNEVVFDARPVAGGILCTNGKWRAKDGSAEGTTPFEVFIKDGLRRMKP